MNAGSRSNKTKTTPVTTRELPLAAAHQPPEPPRSRNSNWNCHCDSTIRPRSNPIELSPAQPGRQHPASTLRPAGAKSSTYRQTTAWQLCLP